MLSIRLERFVSSYVERIINRTYKHMVTVIVIARARSNCFILASVMACTVNRVSSKQSLLLQSLLISLRQSR